VRIERESRERTCQDYALRILGNDVRTLRTTRQSRSRPSRCAGLALALVVAWTLATSVVADETAKIRVLLTDPARAANEVQLNVPRAFLSPQSAGQVKNDQLKSHWLYLVLKYSGPAITEIRPPSDREVSQGGESLVHLFIRPTTRAHQQDVGRWYKDRVLKDIEHDGTAGIPWVVGKNGVSRHSDGRSAGVEYLTFENESGRLAFVKCFSVVCNARKTFDSEIVIEYRFARSRSANLRGLDSRIDAFLRTVYQKA